jgi:hemin uptake protein HemP
MMNSSSQQEERGQGRIEGEQAAPAERKIAVSGDRIDSRDLFAGSREIIIGHGSDSYRLRLTAQNKLILTK